MPVVDDKTGSPLKASRLVYSGDKGEIWVKAYYDRVFRKIRVSVYDGEYAWLEEIDVADSMNEAEIMKIISERVAETAEAIERAVKELLLAPDNEARARFKELFGREKIGVPPRAFELSGLADRVLYKYGGYIGEIEIILVYDPRRNEAEIEILNWEDYEYENIELHEKGDPEKIIAILEEWLIKSLTE